MAALEKLCGRGVGPADEGVRWQQRVSVQLLDRGGVRDDLRAADGDPAALEALERLRGHLVAWVALGLALCRRRSRIGRQARARGRVSPGVGLLGRGTQVACSGQQYSKSCGAPERDSEGGKDFG